MAIQNNQEGQRWNLFGSKYQPSKTIVDKPGVNAPGVGGVGTGGQTSTGNVEAPRGGVSPTTSNNIGISGVKNGGDAIQNVGSEAAGVGAPSKDAVVGNPVRMQEPSYVQRLGQQQEAQKRAYVPDAENKGRGVARWLSNVFSSPKVQTKEGSRRAQQNIAVLGDTMRHLANLLYVGKKDASPQTIQSQAAVNDAKWKAEDALEAEQEKANREWALKVQKQQDDAAYKAGQLGLSADRNAETKRNNTFNNQLALGNYGLKADANKRENELHPYTMAEKAAGVDYKKAQAKKAEIDAEYAGKLNQALLNQRNQATATSRANERAANARTAKTYQEMDLDGKKGYVVSGRGLGSFYTPKNLSSVQKKSIVERARNAGFVTDEVWSAYQTNDENRKVSADDIIAKLIEYCPQSRAAEAKNILLTGGFRQVNKSLNYE